MSNQASELDQFGPYRLDVTRRAFMRRDQLVPLAPKTFDLLLLLVRSSGRALSKQELMAALWPGTFVEEANLSFQISTLRKALGDGASEWIETIPKHGYRFTADVVMIPCRAGSTPVSAADVESGPAPRPVQAGRDGGRAIWPPCRRSGLPVGGGVSTSFRPERSRRAHNPVSRSPRRSRPTPAPKTARACLRMAARSRSRGTARARTTSTST